MATLFLTCGLPGSGKTTLAKQLERQCPALRLTADDWLVKLHPGLSRGELDVLREGVERSQWRVAQRSLQVGINVVLDWGLWSVEERTSYREQARYAGARVVLCLLELPIDRLWERVHQRNLNDAGFQITRDELELWDSWFERPTPAELALYHSVATLSGS